MATECEIAKDFGFGEYINILPKSKYVPQLVNFGQQINNTQLGIVAKCITDIFNGMCDTNYMYVQHIVKYYMQNNVSLLEMVIVDTLKQIAQNKKKEIDTYLTEQFYTNTSSFVPYVLSQYMQFRRTIKKISNIFYDFNVHFKKCVQNKKIAFIDTIAVYAFIVNVVMQKYTKDSIPLNNIFAKNMDITSSNIGYLLTLHKTYDFFKRFSFVVKDRSTTFGKDIDNFLELPKISDKDTIERIINIINDDITKLVKETNCNTTSKLLFRIENIIECVSKNNPYFVVFYRSKLTSRLTYLNYTPELINCEKSLLSKIFVADDADRKLLCQMMFQIDDIIQSIQTTTIFQKHVVLGQNLSEKYKSIDRSTVNMKCCKFNTLRSSVWFDTHKKTEYVAPAEMSLYLDLFKNCYAKIYPTRELSYVYDFSTGIVSFTSKSGVYNIKMTLSQMMVFVEINNKKAISGNDLSVNLKIPLGDLTTIINSLLATQLIWRDNGSGANAVFMINDNFSFDAHDVSIVGVQQKVEPLDEEKVYGVLGIIKKKSPCIYSDLLMACRLEINFGDVPYLKEILNFLINNKSISTDESGNIYTYVKNTDLPNDFDDISDSDESTETTDSSDNELSDVQPKVNDNKEVNSKIDVNKSNDVQNISTD